MAKDVSFHLYKPTVASLVMSNEARARMHDIGVLDPSCKHLSIRYALRPPEPAELQRDVLPPHYFARSALRHGALTLFNRLIHTIRNECVVLMDNGRFYYNPNQPTLPVRIPYLQRPSKPNGHSYRPPPPVSAITGDTRTDIGRC